MKKYTLLYEGKGISLNDFYSGKHWTVRSNAKKKYRNIFDILLLEAKVKWMDAYRVDMTYNSRHDCDNVVTMIKFLNDSMKKVYAKEDDPRYFKGFSIAIDKQMKPNTFKFDITQLK